MAVQKVANKKADVKVSESKKEDAKTVKEEVVTPEVEVTTEDNIESDAPQEDAKETEVDETEVSVTTGDDSSDITDEPEVSVTVSEVDNSNIPAVKNVRVKLREDVRLTYAGENYIFKEGSSYHVSPSLKLHLNRLGVLAPL